MSNTNEKWSGKSCHTSGGPACHSRVMYQCGEAADASHKWLQHRPVLMQPHQDTNGLARGRSSDSRVFMLFVVLRAADSPSILWLFVAVSEVCLTW